MTNRQCQSTGVPGPHLIHGSLSPPEPTTQTSPQSIQPFLNSSRLSLGMPGHVLSPKNFPFAWRSGAHLVHASLGSSESITQMASQSVQPLLHSSRRSRRRCRGMPFPSILPVPIGRSEPLSNVVPWVNPIQHLKRHLNLFSHLCTAHGRQSLFYNEPLSP